MSASLTTFLLMAAMIGCTVIANLLMKLGAGDAPSAFLLNLTSWRTLIGLSIFGMAAVLYAAVLKILPLHVAQAYAAAQFIAVILAAIVILGEEITLLRIAGIALIAAGIVVVSISKSAT